MNEMNHAQPSSGSNKPILVGIGIILIGYIVTLGFGVPQAGTEMIVEAEEMRQEAEASPHEPEPEAHATPPAIWTVLPFVLLLGSIAVLPLIPATEHWWESNRNRFLVAAGLGVLTLAYYLILHHHAVAAHWPAHPDWPHQHTMEPSATGLNFLVAWGVFANAILAEYIPFIMLLFSLYTISGGIRIQGDLRAHPLTNSAIIAVGGLMASFVGTTGAAMLLIRLLLETNKERRHVKHTVVFFIFVVCNCGGCLLPIGDPPLFLGYLRGVDFLWTFNLWPAWLFVNGMLIATYYLLDRFWYYPHEEEIDIARDETRVRGLKITGLWPNALLLLGVVLSVALLDPLKVLPLTNWHPWVYLREIAQLGLVALSLILGSAVVRRANNFNYHAIVEVAALFFGIFICMQPALQILSERGPQLGLSTSMEFFWLTGGLSAVLDNAPTYVVFFETAKTLGGTDLMAGVQQALLEAVSLGAVFMGAMTYIGNGPNFMVKAIAEKSGVRMPSFFGYMLYSCIFLLPLLVITTLIFLR